MLQVNWSTLFFLFMLTLFDQIWLLHFSQVSLPQALPGHVATAAAEQAAMFKSIELGHPCASMTRLACLALNLEHVSG